jgi:hypothetical protein
LRSRSEELAALAATMQNSGGGVAMVRSRYPPPLSAGNADSHVPVTSRRSFRLPCGVAASSPPIKHVMRG